MKRIANTKLDGRTPRTRLNTVLHTHSSALHNPSAYSNFYTFIQTFGQRLTAPALIPSKCLDLRNCFQAYALLKVFRTIKALSNQALRFYPSLDGPRALKLNSIDKTADKSTVFGLCSHWLLNDDRLALPSFNF